MAITVNPYNKMAEYIGDGTIDLDNDSFKMALCSALTFTATNTVWADVSATDIGTANGYTAGGQVMSGVTWVESGGTVTFDSTDVTWTASGGSISATDSVMYDDTPSAPTDPLLINYDFGATESAGDGTDFIIQGPASGWFTATVT